MNCKYSIIIPAYNEEKCIKPLITNIQKIDSTTNKNVEIVFLNDGSTDDTLKFISTWIPKYLKLKILSHPINLGYGAALNSGIELAEGKYIVSMDSDGQHDSRDALKLLKILSHQKTALMLIGTRANEKSFEIRNIAKYFLKVFQNYILGVNFKDANSGMKALEKSSYKVINKYFPVPFDMTFSQYIPLILSILDKRFVNEVNIKVKPRKAGLSHIRPVDFFAAINRIAYIALNLFPRRFGILLSLKTILISIIYSSFIIYLNRKGIPNGGVILIIISLLIFFYTENRQIMLTAYLVKLSKK